MCAVLCLVQRVDCWYQWVYGCFIVVVQICMSILLDFVTFWHGDYQQVRVWRGVCILIYQIMKTRQLFIETGSPLNRLQAGQKSEIAAIVLTVICILTAVLTSLMIN